MAEVQIQTSDGPTWPFYFACALFLIGTGALLAMLYLLFTRPGLLELDVAGGLIGVAAIISGVGFLDKVPRLITVDSDSIQVLYLLSRVRLKWDELRAPVRSGPGLLGFYVVPGTHGVWGGLIVTTEQARAILHHSSCPHFDLPSDVVDELHRSE